MGICLGDPVDCSFQNDECNDGACNPARALARYGLNISLLSSLLHELANAEEQSADGCDPGEVSSGNAGEACPADHSRVSSKLSMEC